MITARRIVPDLDVDLRFDPDGRYAHRVSTADDFETRLTTVEREVARLRDQATLTGSDATVARADAAAARVLAADADHDVSEIRAERRAHTPTLNALRETQLEQGRELADLRAEMREGFATVATGMTQITALLTNLAGPETLE